MNDKTEKSYVEELEQYRAAVDALLLCCIALLRKRKVPRVRFNVTFLQDLKDSMVRGERHLYYGIQQEGDKIFHVLEWKVGEDPLLKSQDISPEGERSE